MVSIIKILLITGLHTGFGAGGGGQIELPKIFVCVCVGGGGGNTIWKCIGVHKLLLSGTVYYR